MLFGTVLLAALLAGFVSYLVQWLCGRLSVPSWLSTILYGASLVYAFWLFLNVGPIPIGH